MLVRALSVAHDRAPALDEQHERSTVVCRRSRSPTTERHDEPSFGDEQVALGWWAAPVFVLARVPRRAWSDRDARGCEQLLPVSVVASM
jgi:hypothetical protein